MKLKYIIIGALVGCIGIVLVFALTTRFNPLTSSNTFLAGINYGRLTRDQVNTHLGTDFILPATITLSAQNFQTTLNTASFSATLDSTTTVSKMVPVFQLNLTEFIQSKLRQSNLPLHYQLAINYDDSSLSALLASIAGQLEKPYIPTELQLSGDTISIKSGDPGVLLDVSSLKTTIIEKLKNWQISQSIPLPLKPAGQLPDDAQISASIVRAKKLIGKSLILTYENQSINIDDSTLISWLGFYDNLQNDKILEYVKTTAPTIKRNPVNAVFKFENNQVLEFRPATPGISLDPQKMANLIQAEYAQLFNTDQKAISLSLPVDYVQPSIQTQDVNNLGIKELLGSGVSIFKHSSAIRNMNVERGAAVVNRILVAPGEEFSFIKSLGEVTLENGFKKAYIIRQGKTELDVGGGVCQVSTTFFRAMLNAGVDITARQNHAYRVSYYEEDMPPGYDATVFIPNPDLKFINDTGHHVLIQNTYDGVNKKLTYEIYGTSDGRQVEISNYRKWGASPPPPDRWIDDPTLPPGKVVQDEQRIAGLKTAFDWKVIRGSEVIHQKTFQSNFVPWAAVFRRGPSI